MTEGALQHFEFMATVHRNNHVTVGGVEIGLVRRNRFTDRLWFAHTNTRQVLTPTGCPLLGFRTRKLAVRALIEAAEEALTKGQPK